MSEYIKLKEKGANIKLSSKEELNNAAVTLTWHTPQDFDLGIIYIGKNGPLGMVYFGDRGSLDKFPYIMLDQDAGVGDTVDNNTENSETLTIGRIHEHSKLFILCWDYGAIKSKSSARFENTDAVLTIKTNINSNNETEYSIPLVKISNENELYKYNVAIIAEIDNTSNYPILINKSDVIFVDNWTFSDNSFEAFVNKLIEDNLK
jgi:tellurite resistance protein TerA